MNNPTEKTWNPDVATLPTSFEVGKAESETGMINSAADQKSLSAIRFADVNNATTAQEAAILLYQAGFIPIKTAGKYPAEGKSWQEKQYANEEEVRQHFADWQGLVEHPEQQADGSFKEVLRPANVGVLTDGYFMFGCNTQEALDAARAECPFYDDTLQRQGNRPYACAIFKRTDNAPFKKTKLTKRDENDKDAYVTLADLWTDNSQFVAWGIHPDNPEVRYRFLNTDKPILPATDEYLREMIGRVAHRLGITNPYAKIDPASSAHEPNSIFERVKAVARISDILHNSATRILCPLHKQKSSNPACVVYDDKTMYCHSNGCWADAIGLYAKLNGIGQYEAAKALAEKYGVVVEITKPKKQEERLTIYERCKMIRAETEEEKNAVEKYFQQIGKSLVFIPKYLAEDLMLDRKIITPRGTEAYAYNPQKGFYEYAETYLKNEFYKRLGSLGSSGKYRETTFVIETKTITSVQELEPPLEKVCLANGILDLTTLTLEPHSPDFFFTGALPINYNPEARCPRINKFINEVVMPEDVPVLYEAIAYCLLRDCPIEKAIFLVGSGRNGKSVYLTLVTKFLGDENCTHLSLQTINESRFMQASLYQKLANIHNDLPSDKIKDDGLFKQLTGRDAFNAEIKHRPYPLKFYNYAKMMFAANQLPETNDQSDAFYRRTKIISFPNEFDGDKANPNLVGELTTQEELSGLLNECLKVLPALRARNDYSSVESIEVQRSRYELNSSPVSAFIQLCIEEEPKGWEETSKLYAAFCSFCRERNVLAVKEMQFVDALKAKTCAVKRRDTTGERKNGYAGIRLKTNINNPMTSVTNEAKNSSTLLNFQRF